MSQAAMSIPDGFDNLSVEEKLDYLHMLWDRIAASDPSQIPVPDWHRVTLAERRQAYRNDNNPGRPWMEVRDELLASLKSNRDD